MDDEVMQAPLDEGEGRDLAIVKGFLGMVPVVGGLLAEVAGLSGNVLARRQEAWMTEVTSAINTLMRRTNLTAEELMRNEVFVSFLLNASASAMRTHRFEKVQALRNAVVTVGQSGFGEEDLAFQYLRYIDELTVSHLIVLKVVVDHSLGPTNVRSFEQAHVLLCTRGLPGNIPREATRAYLRDLDARGLVAAGDLEDLPEFESAGGYIAVEGTNRLPLQATELGRRFLDFMAEKASESEG